MSEKLFKLRNYPEKELRIKKIIRKVVQFKEKQRKLDIIKKHCQEKPLKSRKQRKETKFFKKTKKVEKFEKISGIVKIERNIEKSR